MSNISSCRTVFFAAILRHQVNMFVEGIKTCAIKIDVLDGMAFSYSFHVTQTPPEV
jgi:hypothetical protein